MLRLYTALGVAEGRVALRMTTRKIPFRMTERKMTEKEKLKLRSQ
jgi:hypothetical protein